MQLENGAPNTGGSLTPETGALGPHDEDEGRVDENENAAALTALSRVTSGGEDASVWLRR